MNIHSLQGSQSAVTGDVTTGEAFQRETASGGVLTYIPHRWNPAGPLTDDVYPGFEFTLDCIRAGDGLRHFRPTESLTAFVLKASLGGHAVLRSARPVSGEENFSYHVMRLLYQKADRLQENLHRPFRRARDLRLTRPERITQNTQNVLPVGLGLNADGTGRSWTDSQLVRRGRKAAIQAGDLNPDPEQCIRWGILEAARQNPVDVHALSESAALNSIRLSLFDLGPADGPIDQMTCDRVVERLLAAMEHHIADTTAKFDSWFFEKAADIVRRIEKQKRNGGPIDRQVVRQVMLETVFSASRYVGDCVHAQMSAFADQLPEPLNEQEQTLFDGLYRRQPCLGRLPLILLGNRFGTMREIVSELLNNPADPELWGVLLRVLEFQAEMVRNKRESERHYASRRSGGNLHSTPVDVPMHDGIADSADQQSVLDDLGEVAAELRRRRGAACSCGSLWDWHATLNAEQSSTDELVFDDRCGMCGHTEPLTVPAAEAHRIHRQLQEQ